MEVVQKYVRGCDEDLAAAGTLLDAGHPFYVGFLCHQALFKLLRGYYLETQNRYPPNEPHLPTLAETCGLKGDLGEDSLEFLHELSFFPQVVAQSVYRQKLIETGAKGEAVLQRARVMVEELKRRFLWE